MPVSHGSTALILVRAVPKSITHVHLGLPPFPTNSYGAFVKELFPYIFIVCRGCRENAFSHLVSTKFSGDSGGKETGSCMTCKSLFLRHTLIHVTKNGCQLMIRWPLPPTCATMPRLWGAWIEPSATCITGKQVPEEYTPPVLWFLLFLKRIPPDFFLHETTT